MPTLQAIARHVITAGKEAELLALYPQLVAATRTEPGNLAFVAYQQLDDPRSIVLLERYTSREAFEAHRQTPHFKDLILGQIVPHLDARTIELYDVAEEEPR